jgi:hypothetical protein
VHSGGTDAQVGGIGGTTADRLAGNGEAIATGAIAGIGVDTGKPFCSAEGLFLDGKVSDTLV